jgi:FliI/YscN family ATPase
VGKSTLLGMIARYSQAEVNVVGLIGERGREVREFVENDLGEEGLAKTVLVVATGDEPAVLRAKAAQTATAIAEHFRDQGADVLLMMDSLTRYAMALREIGLAAGEPPTTRGYTPSVFSAVPRLLERAGQGPKGSITAVYTVLVEGDDHDEPVADLARSVLDGHVVLSRKLTNAGHYPPIDVGQSLSRTMPFVVSPDHVRAANQVREWMAAHREVEDLVAIGAYQPGSKPAADQALERWPAILALLRQDRGERRSAESSRAALREAAGA